VRYTATLALLIALSTPAFAQESPPPPHARPATITLSGEGSVFAEPDMATLSAGVVTQADTARAALDANNEAVGKVLDAFRKAGIADRDLQTNGFSVQPRMVYPDQSKGDAKPPHIAGYEVRNNVSVKVRDLDKLGAVLDAAVTSGGNQIDGLSFGISKEDTLTDEARKKAVADARHKAELYAEAAGVKLGKVRRIIEGPVAQPPRPMMMRAMAAKEDSSVPVARGEQEISARVTMTWDLP